MASDWQIGDLAVCVTSGSWGTWTGVPISDHPREGQVFTVIGVTDTAKGLALALKEYPDLWASAFSFRKIRPDAHEACEEEFVTLLKRKNSKVSA